MKSYKDTVHASLYIVLAALLTVVIAGCAMPTSAVQDNGSSHEVAQDTGSGKEIAVEMDFSGAKGIGSKGIASGLTVKTRSFNKTTRQQVGADRTLTWDGTKYVGYANVGTYSGNILVHIWGIDAATGEIGGQGTFDGATTVPKITITAATEYSLRQMGPGGGWISSINAGGYTTTGGKHWKYVETGPLNGTTNAAAGVPSGCETLGLAWGPSGASEGTTSGSGYGTANTGLLAGLGASYASATYYNTFTYNGQSDWVIPTVTELQDMYTNLKLTVPPVGAPTFKNNQVYCSSEQNSTTIIRGVKINNNATLDTTKTKVATNLYTRAVREF